jgi:hypothetical protein
MIFRKRILVEAIALALVTTPLILHAANDAVCTGHFFEQSEEIPDVTPPTVRMITHQLLQLKAGESLVVSLEHTTDSGEASFFSCADKGQLVAEVPDFSQIKYTAPPYIKETQIIKWGVQISDNLGYVGGDSLLLRLIASGAGNPYIVVGTSDNKILIYSLTGNLENDIAAIAQQLDALDSDNDDLDEIIADDGTNIAVYEFNGEISEPLSLDDAFFVKADVNGDGTKETILGSQDANEVSVDGISFTVFQSATQTRRGERKGNKGKGTVTICHKGKQTKTLPESALKGHLGHGDTMGACPPPPPSKPEEKVIIQQPQPEKKVTICHKGKESITISKNALPAHVAHGDTEGSCHIIIDNDKIYGVNVAAGDLNGDGKANIVAAMAKNGSLVEIYTGDKQLLKSFNAFESNNGVLVAVGDVTSDGQAEIITAEPNGTEIRIFDANGIQTGGFSVSGNIISLAVGISTIEETPSPIIEGDITTVAPQPDESPQLSTDTGELLPDTIASTTGSEVIETIAPEETPIEEIIEIIPEGYIKINGELIKTTTDESPVKLPPPTTGSISNSYEYEADEILTNVVIEEGVSISNIQLEGEITNYGLVSNAVILPNTLFIGGKMSGYITNQGTIADTEFVGAVLEGSILSGTITITIEGSGLGILKDVTLAKSAHILGGVLSGIVTGDPNEPALIENAEILAGTILENVIIGQGTQVADDVEKR